MGVKMYWDICEAAQALHEGESQTCQVNDTQVFWHRSDTFGLYRDVIDSGFPVLVKRNTAHTLFH